MIGPQYKRGGDDAQGSFEDLNLGGVVNRGQCILAHEDKNFVELSTYDVEVPRDVLEAGVLPRGSALITSSGSLAESGISAILHAASGSRYIKTGNFKPNLKGVVDSIRNCFLLAERHSQRFPDQARKIAVPFIGGKAFLEHIQEDIQSFTKDDLARTVVEACLQNLGNFEVCFVAHGNEDTQRFQNILSDVCKEERFSHLDDRARVLCGDITDFSLHTCPLIVNAANMEVEFGSGVAEAIGNATGDGAAIDLEARELIDEYLQLMAS